MRDYLLPIAIVVAAVILTATLWVWFRYLPIEGGILDRWTGCVAYRPPSGFIYRSTVLHAGEAGVQICP